MRWFLFIVILLVATLLEASNLLKLFTFSGWAIRPSILIVMLTYYALAGQTKDAIVTSFLIGFAADITSGLMGPHTLCFGLMGLLLNQSNQVLLVKRAIYKVLVVFIVYFVTETFSYWLGLLKGPGSHGNYYSVMLFTGLYSAIIGPVIWSILSGLSGWVSVKKSRNAWVYD